MLMECLLYIALVMVLVGLGLASLHMAFTHSLHLREGTDRILLALHAGEQWRADIRAASGPPQLETSATNLTLKILTANGGTVDYAFFDATIWRRTASQAAWQPLLRGVESTRFLPEERRRVRGWRWEVELMRHKKARGMKPLLTFQAVPGFGSHP